MGDLVSLSVPYVLRAAFEEAPSLVLQANDPDA